MHLRVNHVFPQNQKHSPVVVTEETSGRVHRLACRTDESRELVMVRL